MSISESLAGPTQIDDLVNRLRERARFNIPYPPEKIMVEAADALEAKEARVKELEKVIAWANNSLFGSHSFFLSVNGSKDNEHHLDEAIEKLKEQTGSDYARIASLEAQLKAFREAAGRVKAVVETQTYLTHGAAFDALMSALRMEREKDDVE